MHAHPLPEQLRQTEVEQLRGGRVVLVERDEHVLGLEVPVGDPCSVGSGERARELSKDGLRFGEGQTTPLVEQSIERDPVQELHHVVLPTVFERAEVEDVDDVAVPDLVDRTRLRHESKRHLRVGAVLALDHLDRGRLADHRVLGLVHGTEATFAEQREDPVFAHDRPGSEQLVRGRREVVGRGDQRRTVALAYERAVRVLGEAAGAGDHVGEGLEVTSGGGQKCAWIGAPRERGSTMSASEVHVERGVVT